MMTEYQTSFQGQNNPLRFYSDQVINQKKNNDQQVSDRKSRSKQPIEFLQRSSHQSEKKHQ
jgi:hypothetical protein